MPDGARRILGCDGVVISFNGNLVGDPRVRNIAVRDHDLGGYDGLAGQPEEGCEE